MKNFNQICFLFIDILILGYSCVEPEELDEYADWQREKNNIPGMAISVVKADTI